MEKARDFNYNDAHIHFELLLEDIFSDVMDVPHTGLVFSFEFENSLFYYLTPILRSWYSLSMKAE